MDTRLWVILQVFMKTLDQHIEYLLLDKFWKEANNHPIYVFIGPLYLIDMWFGEEQRVNIIKTHV